MPGIVTHNKIFQESVRRLGHRRKKNYLQRSITALLSDPSFRKAALFGSIGPNIFDYIPTGRDKKHFGSEASFSMHNGGGYGVIEFFLNSLFDHRDKNNEWNAVRRAYIYGFASHMAADAVIHPFVFYNSGFPENQESRDKYILREQNLLFQYNIDRYYQFYEEKTSELPFILEDMLPVSQKGRLLRLNSSVRAFILEMLQSVYPEIYKRVVLFKTKSNPELLTMLDLLPYFIKTAYRIKCSPKRGRIDNLNRTLRIKGMYSPDFLVKYPPGKRYRIDPLNHHKDRWQNPAGPPGFRYDSIDNLFNEACEKVVDIWENFERCVYEGFDYSVVEDMRFNAYTGEKQSFYGNMTHQYPVRLRF